jgi:hypothetical protein
MTNDPQAEMRAPTAELKADIERFRADVVRCILLAMIAGGVLNGVVAAVLNPWWTIG